MNQIVVGDESHWTGFRCLESNGPSSAGRILERRGILPHDNCYWYGFCAALSGLPVSE
ncbi:hypothetical protein PGB90_009549 [Kerria lacca]